MIHRRGRGHRPRSLLALAAAGLAVLSLPGAAGAAPPDRPARAVASASGQEAGPAPVLTGQTPSVAVGDTFEVRLDPASLPAGGSVAVALHGRVRSRSELAASMDGEGLRTVVYDVARSVTELGTSADGSRVIGISLDPAAPGGLNVSAPGVYPLEVTALDAAGARLGTLVTHLVLAPQPDDESPPLSVAVVARVPDGPALQPDGSIDLDPEVLAESALWAAALAASGAPVNVAVGPEALSAIAADPRPPAAELVAGLRQLAATGSVVARPYAPSSPDALAAAGLPEELARQMDAGQAALRDILGVSPSPGTWLAGGDLDEAGVGLLRGVGVRHVVVAADQVAPLRSGLLSLSLAQPFLLPADDDADPIDALSLDDQILEHLDSDAEPALEASRVLTELAMLWFEQPGVPRAAVIPVSPRVRPEVVSALVSGLERSHVLEPVRVDDAFDRAEPLRQPGGGRVDRTLTPEDHAPIARPVRTGLASARRLLASFAGLVGDAEPSLQTAQAHLLLATSSALDETEQEAHLTAATAVVDGVTGMVTAPVRETITLTARDGTVPLTLR
ncbi:MAG TPA: hypothetical protein VFV32_04565, partial [Acidimicrobiales bacterium]|nr:hypothetical protein [Acidimicrobiales bacterium]